jgi:SEC-C motif domain protein
VVSGERLADTAEALMRSRYTAYALGDGDHLFRTWHPRTRTDDAAPDPRVRWTGLEVLDIVGGGPDDAEGVVEFRARWVSDDDGPVRRGELHERSRFLRRGGRWVYVEAE